MDQVVAGTFGKIKSAALNADGLVVMDQLVDGDYSKVLATSISAGKIRLDEVVEYTNYQTVTGSQKTSWNSKPETMDQIGEGSTYKRVRATQIDAGYLKLTSQTTKDGKWYSESGIIIDAGVGIEIHGGVGTWHTSAGTYRGCLNADGSVFYVWSNDILEINTYDSGYDIRVATKNNYWFYPYFNDYTYLGTSSKYWKRVYANTYYGKNTTIQSFQSHDDIQMLRSIKHRDGMLDIDTFPAEIVESDDEMQQCRQQIKRKDDEHDQALQTEYQQLKDELGKAQRGNLPEAQKQKAVRDIDQRIAQQEKAIEDAHRRRSEADSTMEASKDTKGIDMLGWQSLLMGSILQLADKVEALEKKLNEG